MSHSIIIQQGSIGFNIVNCSLWTWKDYTMHSLMMNRMADGRAPSKRRMYWVIHPRCPTDFPRPERCLRAHLNWVKNALKAPLQWWPELHEFTYKTRLNIRPKLRYRKLKVSKNWKLRKMTRVTWVTRQTRQTRQIGVVRELSNMQNCQSPVSISQSVSHRRSSVQEMLTHLKTTQVHYLFMGGVKTQKCQNLQLGRLCITSQPWHQNTM